MKNTSFFLLFATSIICFNPVAVRSQEGLHSVPVTSTDPAPHAEAEQVEGNTENGITSPESSHQNQPDFTTTSEENIEEISPSESPNLHQPESVEQSGETPGAENGQAEESTPTMGELYSQLEQDLDNQKWQQADQATYELMLLIAGPKSEAQGYFDKLEWESFPCEEFRRIDSLWGAASQGQQGFTAQLNIFREVDGSSTYFDRIGWQQGGAWVVRWQYSRDNKRASYLEGMQPNFVDPPAGHLPALLQWSSGQDFRLDKAASCLVQ